MLIIFLSESEISVTIMISASHHLSGCHHFSGEISSNFTDYPGDRKNQMERPCPHPNRKNTSPG